MALTERATRKLDEMIAEGHSTSVFVIGLTLALIKDGVMDWVFDFVLIGEIPIIGQIPGMLLSALLVYFMWGKGMLKRKIAARFIIFMLADSLPFLNNLPLTTVAMLLSWRHIKQRARQAETDLGELHTKTQRELELIAQQE